MKRIEPKGVSDTRPVGRRASRAGADPRYKAAPSMSPKKGKYRSSAFHIAIEQDADREMYGDQSEYGYDHSRIGNK